MKDKFCKLIVLLFLVVCLSVSAASAQTWTKVDDRDASVTLYGSDWTLGDGWLPGAYMDTLSISASSGNYAIYSFTGTKVRLYAGKADDGGTANIYIDDVPDGTVNFFDSSDLGDVLVYESGTLSSSSHQLKVEWASGTRIYIDAFEYQEGVADTDPPTPDPMTFASNPTANGEDSISMTATTASDPSGVEYFFDETTGNPGGSDSGWQDSSSYTDTGLNAGTQYCYQVKARDKSPNQNETAYSASECATTTSPDTDSPTPDPLVWASVPAAISSSAIEMTAATASDPSGVEYYFDETSGNPGGSDSGWQDSATYTDAGLNAETQYCYQVKARDKSSNQNETAYSSNQCATTHAAPAAPAVVYPDGGSEQEMLAAKEVRRYIYLRTDQLLNLQAVTSLPGSGDLILIANDDDPMVESLRSLINHTTNTGGFIIKTVNSGGRNILVITGNDSDATLVAAYRYAEHLGIFFGLAGDTIPDAIITLDITGFDEVGEPLFETRGIQPYHDFPEGPDLWNTDDYIAVISQLPKLGMNFIGIHTYTTWNSWWDYENNHERGPEPSVWIGLPQDVNPDGTVSWSYPAYYAHTKRPNYIWGFDTWDTDQFSGGANQLFPTNGYGSDVIGESVPTNMAGYIAVSDRAGALFNEAFTHAQNIGVKTATGTELPLGVEVDGGDTWVRGMPPELQTRLTGMSLDPADPAVVKDVYKGIFERIMKTHPLDYYWLWSYEIWANDGATSAEIQSFENDITIAQQALSELGNPFQIAHAGWILGTSTNPAEFEDVFPSQAPFFSLLGSAIGYESLSAQRVKWPGTWLEYDWGLAQPQLALYRIHEDASAAWSKNCDGFITEHWRTRIMSPNIGSMKDLVWAYGPTGTPVTKTVPDIGTWMDVYYLDWATRQFGPQAAASIAAIFSEQDWETLPHALDWTEEMTGSYYMAPGAILPNSTSWSQEQSNYTFVSQLEALRPQIVGTGNLERFDYWLKAMQALRIMGEYGCIRDDFESACGSGNWSTALNHRISMANLWEQLMTLMVEKATNASDLGEIINLEIINWKQLMMNKWDTQMEAGLGGSLPPEANPSTNYTGSACVKVTPARTQVYDGESLDLTVLIMENPTSATLYYRPLGGGSYSSLSLTNVARGVYEVTIPAQSDDFEYYIDAQTPIGNAAYPVTAPTINHSVVVLTTGGQVDTTPPTPNPATFASAPSADSDTAISMTATTGSDPSGPVEYFFDETSGNPGGSDSGWQTSTSYTDTGLSPDTQYTYTVQMRDAVPNTGTTSSPANTTTDPLPDTTPPTPDPMTWQTLPNPDSGVAISMEATTATDPSGVEYYFNNVTDPVHDSGWQGNPAYTDSGLTPDTQYTYQVKARDQSPAQNETAYSTAESATTLPPPSLQAENGIVSSVGNSWQTVTLTNTYDSMVVVTTANYDNTSGPVVVRIQNASGNSFDLRVDPAGGATPSGIDVYYLVVEEGVYTVAQHGVMMEAVKYNSTVTDENNSWVGEPRTYSNTYTSPVVLGQVMTYSDPAFSTFWCYGSSRLNPPDTSNLNTGKTVSEDTDTTRANETVGYIVIEAGSGNINGENYVAALGADSVRGVTDSPPYTYSISGLSGASVAITILNAMDGNNGGWAVLYGASPVSASAINLAIDEDQVNDTERAHATEQVAYIVFEDTGAPDTDPPTPDPATFASAPAAVSDTAISMTATTGSDPSGPVEYFFDETSGNPGGSDSGWQTSTTYTDTGLSPSTQYTYTVTMRDALANTGTASAPANATTQATPDTDPPTPNPATFASPPSADSDTAISMTATTGSDPSGPVEYFFDETSGNPGGSDSGWQTSTSYTDTGLNPDTQYTYTVQMRDSVPNTGTASAPANATTDPPPPDTTPPTPNPATWASVPSADGTDSISMTATTGSDPSGVEYFFDETSGNPGGSDSGWQTSANYTDTGLNADTQYTYTVQMRDSVPNTGSASSPASATTLPDTGWTQIISDDFEGGFGNWNDGGTDCSLYTGGTYAHQGSNAVLIVDNSTPPASTTYTNNLALAAYDEVKVDFWYYPDSMDNSAEDFWLEISTNGGSDWTTVEEWNQGDEFVNGNFYPDSVIITGYTLTNNTQLRFRCHASGNKDYIYLDEVVVSAQGGGAPDTDPPTPNPATWASVPSADSSSAISMTATTGSDPSGPVEYFFDETSGNPGGSDSGWQTSPNYTDSGLNASTQYTYTVTMRDALSNTGTASSPVSATTQAGGTWTKLDDRDVSVTLYGSDWTLGDGWLPGCYQDTVSISASSGNYAIYSFTGTQVRLYVGKADDGGTANIYIDDVPDGTVNFYDAADLGDVLVYESGTLSSGPHELKVEWASGTRMYLDAFEYYGP